MDRKKTWNLPMQHVHSSFKFKINIKFNQFVFFCYFTTLLSATIAPVITAQQQSNPISDCFKQLKFEQIKGQNTINGTSVPNIAEVKPNVDVIFCLTEDSGPATPIIITLMLNATVTAECKQVLVQFSIANERVAEIQPYQNVPYPPNGIYFLNQSNPKAMFQMRAKILGITSLVTTQYYHNGTAIHLIYQERKPGIAATFYKDEADNAYEILSNVFTVFAQLDIGLRTKMVALKEIAKHPVPTILALACHFTILPLVTFAVAKIIQLDQLEIAFGFLMAGVVSGGGLSNLHVSVLGGDYVQSCCMTYLSLLLSMGFTPMWIWLLGNQLTGNAVTGINEPGFYGQLCIAISLYLIPAIYSFIFQHFFPKLGYFCHRYITFPILLLLFLYYCTYGLYTNAWIFQYFDAVVVIGGCLLPYLVFGLSFLVAMAARQPRDKVITIMLEAGIVMSMPKNAFLAVEYESPSKKNADSDCSLILTKNMYTLAAVKRQCYIVIIVQIILGFTQVSLTMSILAYCYPDRIRYGLSTVGPYSVLIFSQVPIVIIEIILKAHERITMRLKNKTKETNTSAIGGGANSVTTEMTAIENNQKADDTSTSGGKNFGNSLSDDPTRRPSTATSGILSMGTTSMTTGDDDDHYEAISLAPSEETKRFYQRQERYFEKEITSDMSGKA